MGLFSHAGGAAAASPELPDGAKRLSPTLTPIESITTDARRTDTWRTDTWRWPLVTFGVALAVLCGLFASTGWSMVEKWWTVPTYGHGFLIVPISVYLLWNRRGEYARLTPRPSLPGLAMMAGAAALWLIGDITSTRVIEQFGFIAMIQALFLAVFGWRVTRAAIFPLLFLYFSVPFGDFVVPTLQAITAEYAVKLLRLTGLPVYVEDLFIHIPSGSFVVAEACAGLRFMISTVVIGFLGAYLFYHSLWRRLLFLALSFIIPVIANVLRAYLIIMIAYWSDNRLAVGADHLIYGWVFLSFVTLSLIGLGLLFREKPAIGAAPPAVGAIGRRSAGAPNASFLAAGLAAIIIAAAAPAYSAWTEPPVFAAGRLALPALTAAEPWRPVEPSGAWRAAFLGATGDKLFSFSNGSAVVDVYIAVYGSQRDGAELINAGNNLGERPIWRPTGGGLTDVSIDGRPVRVATMRLQSNTSKRLAWSWYWLDGQFTANPRLAKLLEAKARLLRHNQAAAAIVLSTPYAELPGEADQVLRDFVTHLPGLARYLAAVTGDLDATQATPAAADAKTPSRSGS